MTGVKDNFTDPGSRLPKLRKQRVTIGEMEYFKTVLIEEIRTLLKEDNSKSPAPWIKSKDVRKLLSVSHETLQNLRIKGTIPLVKLDRTSFYRHEDIVHGLKKESLNIYVDNLELLKSYLGKIISEVRLKGVAVPSLSFYVSAASSVISVCATMYSATHLIKNYRSGLSSLSKNYSPCTAICFLRYIPSYHRRNETSKVNLN